MLNFDTALVEVEWLRDKLREGELILLDASVPPVVPGFESINADGDFKAIPGARRFDYDQQICLRNSSLPHMMPSAEMFEAEVCKLGIDNHSAIVVYDDVGVYASPRAWWMFRAMGHENVAVLNGGLPAWLGAGAPFETGLKQAEQLGDFQARPQDLFCDFEFVLAALDDSACCILDARSSGRFNGTAPEPRPGMRGGHMPGAKNLPFPEVIHEGKMKAPEELREVLSGLANTDQRLITTCGSGLTACVLALAAHICGYQKLSVYDGSWAEWGSPGHLPVETS